MVSSLLVAPAVTAQADWGPEAERVSAEGTALMPTLAACTGDRAVLGWLEYVRADRAVRLFGRVLADGTWSFPTRLGGSGPTPDLGPVAVCGATGDGAVLWVDDPASGPSTLFVRPFDFAAGAWEPTGTIESPVVRLGPEPPSVDVDASGRITAVWMIDAGNNHGDTYKRMAGATSTLADPARWDPTFQLGDWTEATTTQGQGRVAVAPSGDAVVTYTFTRRRVVEGRAYTFDIVYAQTRVGGRWSEPVLLLDAMAPPGAGVAFPVASDAGLGAVWSEGDRLVRGALFRSGTWSAPIELATGTAIRAATVRVARSGAHAIVLWADGTVLFARDLAADGSVGPVHTVGTIDAERSHARIAGTSRGGAAIWTGPSGTFGALYATGVGFGTPVRLGNAGGDPVASITPSGEGWVAWTEDGERPTSIWARRFAIDDAPVRFDGGIVGADGGTRGSRDGGASLPAEDGGTHTGPAGCACRAAGAPPAERHAPILAALGIVIAGVRLGARSRIRSREPLPAER